jgi:hypothetical protein
MKWTGGIWAWMEGCLGLSQRKAVGMGVDVLSFDVGDGELRKQGPGERIWVASGPLAYRATFHEGVIYWPFDLTMDEAARAFYRDECERNGGVMLELEVVRAAGAEGLAGVFKYKSPQAGSPGMAYVGILWLPFSDCRFQVNVEGVEMGTTGMREAVVMSMDMENWPRPGADEPIPHIENDEQLEELRRKAQVRRLPSDDVKYDGMFKEHPLSLVRAGLKRVIESAKLGEEGKGLKAWRVKGG